MDGHVVLHALLTDHQSLRAHAANRGAVSFAGDVRYDGRHHMPDVHGKLTGTGVEMGRYKLARKLDVDADVSSDIVNIPRYEMTFADGDVVLQNRHIKAVCSGRRDARGARRQ